MSVLDPFQRNGMHRFRCIAEKSAKDRDNDAPDVGE
jgi:hypothetical protein